MSNKYTYSVPFTEKELREDYVINYMSQTEIAKKYGVSQKVIWRALHKMGIPTRKAYKRFQERELNSYWKGGRVFDQKKGLGKHQKETGYWMVMCKGHPNANKAGYVYEHILVALKEAGLEKLDNGLCVHHIDFNKQNNIPENLIICDKQVHREYHSKFENLVADLFENGIIEFDKVEGYRLKGG